MNFKSLDHTIFLYRVAMEAHKANNELRITNGEESLGSFTDQPLDIVTINMESIYAALHNPNLTAKDMHDTWMDNKAKDGWVYGDVKDADAKTHPLMIPFEQMNDIDKMKDQIFIDVVCKNRDMYLKDFGELYKWL